LWRRLSENGLLLQSIIFVYITFVYVYISLINLRLAPSISNVDTFNSGNSSDNNASALLVKSSDQISCSKLPNIEIPNFDGKNLNEFKPLYEIFTAVIDRNKNLSDVEKLFYLRSYLKGEALSLINHLPIVNSSYNESFEILKKRYDNEVVL